MAPGRFLTATIVGGIVLFVVGYLIWGLALMSFFEAQSVAPEGALKTMEEFSLAHIFLGNLVYGAFLTLTVGVWGGKRGFGGGFQGGLLVGLLVTLAMTLTFMGTMNFMTVTGHAVDTVVSGVWAGIGGGVIGVILARGEARRA